MWNRVTAIEINGKANDSLGKCYSVLRWQVCVVKLHLPGKASITNLIDLIYRFCCTSNWNSDRSMNMKIAWQFHFIDQNHFVIMSFKLPRSTWWQFYILPQKYAHSAGQFIKTSLLSMIIYCFYFHTISTVFSPLFWYVFPSHDLLYRSLLVFLAIVCLRLPFLFTKSFCWYFAWLKGWYNVLTFKM